MSTEVSIYGRVRSAVRDIFAIGTEQQQRVGEGGELLVTPGLPEHFELVRLGFSWHVQAAAAVAAVIAVPTTAHAFGLYNNEPDGGKSYVIDAVTALITVNTTAALSSFGIITALSNGRQAAIADAGAAAYAIRNLRGKGGGPANARFFLAATALPSNFGWFPVGDTMNTSVNALPGLQLEKIVKGALIVPPGGIFAAHILATQITLSAIIGFRFHELQATLG